MQSSIPATTQLDLVRASAAARQRRAATYRLAPQPRPTSPTTARGAALATLLAVLLAMSTGGLSTATADTPALPHGYEPAHADGWFDPTGGGAVATTAQVSIARAATPLRIGYAAGSPDGWFVPGRPGVRVAGVVIGRSTGSVPHNVR